MSIEIALRNKLLENVNLENIVGERMYLLKLPQNPVYPAVVYFKVSNPRHHAIGVAYPRFQFSVFAKTYKEAKKVADLIRFVIQREKGITGGIPIIQGVYLNEIDLYESDTQLYHIACDYKIIYKGE